MQKSATRKHVFQYPQGESLQPENVELALFMARLKPLVNASTPDLTV